MSRAFEPAVLEPGSRMVQLLQAERVEALYSMIRSCYGERVGEFPDIELFRSILADESQSRVLVEIVSLHGVRGFPYDPVVIMDWMRLGIAPALMFGVFELCQPRSASDRDQIFKALQVHAGRLRVDVLSELASAYQRLGRPMPVSVLGLALEVFGGQGPVVQSGSFTLVAEAYAAIGLIDERLDKILLERVRDEEKLATAAAFIDLLSSRIDDVQTFADIEGLILALKDRVSVRRLARVMALFDEYNVNAGALDTFHFNFANSQTELDWLDRALKGMTDLNRHVDRLTLIQLREWAPEVGALTRYMTAARAFRGMGLSETEIDRLVLKRVETEERSQVLGLLGDVYLRLGFGDLTLQRAEQLADMLQDRPRVKRYETAVGLLRDLKLPPSDVQVLCEQFIDTQDDINWLETFLVSSGEFGEKLGRLKIMHLRERCPEPSHLYRYFKLRRALEWFTGDFSDLDAWLVDVAPSVEMTNALMAVSDIVSLDPGRMSVLELRGLLADYMRPDLVEAFGVCVKTFNGNWRKFEMLMKQVQESGDLAGCFEVLSRSIPGGRLSGSTFERSFEHLFHAMRKSPVVPTPPGH